MEKLSVTQITPEELQALIENAVTNGINQALKKIAEANARPPNEEQDTFLSIQEVSKILGRSRQTCYSLVSRNILISYRLPGIKKMLFKKSQVLNAAKQVTFKYLKNQ